MASGDASSRHFSFEVQASGQRLDVVIVEHMPSLSRSEVQRLIKAGRVLVNDTPSKAAYRVESGDSITVDEFPDDGLTVVAQDIPLKVLYEDSDLIAVDKQAGMVVHPAVGHREGTLVNAALSHWPQLAEVGELERPGVVHRLDKDTSGVILLAKTNAALANLQDQFRERRVQKRYLALVEGIPASSEGLIDAPIGRDPRLRKRMAVIKSGREAVTRYHLLQAFEEQALLELFPQSGRTHQLRIHLAWLGYPVVGDRIYGLRKQSIKMSRHWLHAAGLTVQSPSSGEPLNFEAPLPSALEAVLNSIGYDETDIKSA